jgi:hypothetical protein
LIAATLATVEAWPLSEAVRRSIWAYPALETVHIAAFAVVFGSLALLELRVFGFGRAVPLEPLTRLAVPTALAGFALAAVAGVLMLMSNAAEFAVNTAFQVKLLLIACAGVNALAFHRRGSARRDDGVAKAQALLSLALWTGIIAAGRLIAYI